jgi:hypothetical protein
MITDYHERGIAAFVKNRQRFYLALPVYADGGIVGSGGYSGAWRLMGNSWLDNSTVITV